MVFDQTGNLTSPDGQSGMRRHDYFPFGEEIGAGVGGRTTGQGSSVADGVRQKFTSYERDTETGLDFAETRYYSSTMGRFTRPDDFLNDSDLLDPQSWNKYAYVRNNPLRYVDPTGEKADIKIQTDEEKKTGTITITASIGIYSQGNSNLIQEQLNQARDAIEKSIEGAWNGTFKGKDGITYTVKTDVTVQVHGSESAATESGAQNVIGISTQPASGREISNVVERSFFRGDSGPDKGTWHYASLMERNQAAHEFTHVIGAINTIRQGNVSFSPHPFGDREPVSRYGNATGADYRHALGGRIAAHRQSSRRWEVDPHPMMVRAPRGRWGRERSHTSTRTVVCCR